MLLDEKGLQDQGPAFLIVDTLDEAGDQDRQVQIAALLDDYTLHGVSLMTTSRISPTHGRRQVTCDHCPAPGGALYWICRDCVSPFNESSKDPFAVCYDCYQKGLRCPCGLDSALHPPATMYVALAPSQEDIERYCSSSIQQELNAYRRNDDMPEYRMAQLPRFVRFRDRLKEVDPSFFDKLPSVIAQNADCKYLFANLYMQFLKAQASPLALLDAVDNLRVKSLGGLSAMHNIYHKMIGQCVDPSGGDDAKMARTVLSLVAQAKTTLSFDALSVAVSICEGRVPTLRNVALGCDQQEITECTKGMVLIDDLGDSGPLPVRFFHRTLAEFLESEATTVFPEDKTQMLNVCLAQLELDEAFVAESGSWAVQDVVKDYPFIWYAARFWGHHAREVSHRGQLDGNITRRIFKLLTGSRLEQILRIASIPHPTVPGDWDVSGGVSALHVCAFYDLSWLAHHLIEDQQVDPDVTETFYHQTPLLYACRNGATQTVRALLDAGANVNIQSQRNRTPLLETIFTDISDQSFISKSAPVDIAKMLLESPDVDVNQRLPGLHGSRALVLACERDRPALLECILTHPSIDINASDGAGMTAVARAISAGSLECVQLLSKFASHQKQQVWDVNVPESSAHLTALELINTGTQRFWAAKPKDMLAIAEILLAHDAQVSSRVIEFAIYRTNRALLRLILQTANIRGDWVCNEDGKSLAHLAAGTLDVVMFDAILEALEGDNSFDINRRDAFGSTALHIACSRHEADPTEMIRRLIECNSDTSLSDGRGKTAWQLVLRNPDIDVVKSIAKAFGKDASLIQQTEASYKEIPLWLLIQLGNEKHITKALEAPAEILNLEISAYERSTVLHQATMRGRPDLVKTICAKRLVDINAQNKVGRAALHLAHDCEETTEVLIHFGADADIVDYFQATPLQRAINAKFWDVAIRLIKAGAKIPQTDWLPCQLLHRAIELEDVDTTQKLLDANVDVLRRDPDTRRSSIEHAVVMRRYVEVQEGRQIWHNQRASVHSDEELREFAARTDSVQRYDNILALLRAKEVALGSPAEFAIVTDDEKFEGSLRRAESFIYSGLNRGFTDTEVHSASARSALSEARTTGVHASPPRIQVAERNQSVVDRSYDPSKSGAEDLEGRLLALVGQLELRIQQSQPGRPIISDRLAILCVLLGVLVALVPRFS